MLLVVLKKENLLEDISCLITEVEGWLKLKNDLLYEKFSLLPYFSYPAVMFEQ
jgi:hypothetical protein